LEVQYVGDRQDINGDPLGHYLTSNFTLRASHVWRRWDLSLSVYNIGGGQWSDSTTAGQIKSVPCTAVGKVILDF